MRNLKYIGFLAIVTLLFGEASFSQSAIKATIDYKTFHIPGQGALLDVQFQYAGYSLNYNLIFPLITLILPRKHHEV